MGADGFWVYVLQNPKGRFYIGQTDDPELRLERHNSDRGRKTFTHKHGPWTLVWKEHHPTRASAMTRESQIKAMKSARWIRTHLLNGRVPTCWN